jgi:hypothetical protein
MRGCLELHRPPRARSCGAAPAVVKGEPRLLTNTKGDDGLSRWSLHRAPPPPTTHYEVLVPLGRTGSVPVTAVRPLKTDRPAMPAPGR